MPEPVVEHVVEPSEVSVLLSSHDFAKAYAGDIFGPMRRENEPLLEEDEDKARVLLDLEDKLYAGDIVTSVQIVQDGTRIKDLDIRSWAELSAVARYCWAAWVNGGIPEIWNRATNVVQFGFGTSTFGPNDGTGEVRSVTDRCSDDEFKADRITVKALFPAGPLGFAANGYGGFARMVYPPLEEAEAYNTPDAAFEAWKKVRRHWTAAAEPPHAQSNRIP